MIDEIFKILNTETNNKDIELILNKLDQLKQSQSSNTGEKKEQQYGGKYMKSQPKTSPRARKPSPRGTKTVRKTKPKSKTPKEK